MWLRREDDVSTQADPSAELTFVGTNTVIVADILIGPSFLSQVQ